MRSQYSCNHGGCNCDYNPQCEPFPIYSQPRPDERQVYNDDEFLDQKSTETNLSNIGKHIQDKDPLIDDHPWPTMSRLNEKCCKYAESEYTGVSEFTYQSQQFEANNCNQNLNFLKKAKELMDYDPESTFLKKIKEHYLQQNQEILSVMPSVVKNDNCLPCEHCLTKAQEIIRIGEDLSQKLTQACLCLKNNENEILDDGYRQARLERRRFRPEDLVQEEPQSYPLPPQEEFCPENESRRQSKSPLKPKLHSKSQIISMQTTINAKSHSKSQTRSQSKSRQQTRSQSKSRQQTRSKSHSGEQKKKKQKSIHVSRSKKPGRSKGKRMRTSSDAIECKSEDQFEPTLKRPHENSCERCWRFASPQRSPVNKPDQKYDPNFRKAHSQTDFPPGGSGGGSGDGSDRRKVPETDIRPDPNLSIVNSRSGAIMSEYAQDRRLTSPVQQEKQKRQQQEINRKIIQEQQQQEQMRRQQMAMQEQQQQEQMRHHQMLLQELFQRQQQQEQMRRQQMAMQEHQQHEQMRRQQMAMQQQQQQEQMRRQQIAKQEQQQQEQRRCQQMLQERQRQLQQQQQQRRSPPASAEFQTFLDEHSHTQAPETNVQKRIVLGTPKRLFSQTQPDRSEGTENVPTYDSFVKGLDQTEYLKIASRHQIPAHRTQTPHSNTVLPSRKRSKSKPLLTSGRKMSDSRRRTGDSSHKKISQTTPRSPKRKGSLSPKSPRSDGKKSPKSTPNKCSSQWKDSFMEGPRVHVVKAEIHSPPRSRTSSKRGRSPKTKARRKSTAQKKPTPRSRSPDIQVIEEGTWISNTEGMAASKRVHTQSSNSFAPHLNKTDPAGGNPDSGKKKYFSCHCTQREFINYTKGPSPSSYQGTSYQFVYENACPCYGSSPVTVPFPHYVEEKNMECPFLKSQRVMYVKQNLSGNLGYPPKDTTQWSPRGDVSPKDRRWNDSNQDPYRNTGYPAQENTQMMSMNGTRSPRNAPNQDLNGNLGYSPKDNTPRRDASPRGRRLNASNQNPYGITGYPAQENTQMMSMPGIRSPRNVSNQNPYGSPIENKQGMSMDNKSCRENQSNIENTDYENIQGMSMNSRSPRRQIPAENNQWQQPYNHIQNQTNEECPVEENIQWASMHVRSPRTQKTMVSNRNFPGNMGYPPHENTPASLVQSMKPQQNSQNFSANFACPAEESAKWTSIYGQTSRMLDSRNNTGNYVQGNARSGYSSRIQHSNIPNQNPECMEGPASENTQWVTMNGRTLPYEQHANPGFVSPRRYCVFYMTKNNENKKNDVEVLVEEFQPTPQQKKDTQGKDLKEKMKRVMECKPDSMALRFQKGVFESCGNPPKSRTLYF